MGKSSAWKDGTAEKNTTEDLVVVLFISRNKDNKDIKDYKERRKSFLASKSRMENFKSEFEAFVKDGKQNEVSRLYVSVNIRNSEKINKALLHYLIDNPKTNPASLPQLLASISAKSENAKEHKWLFDFDESDFQKLIEFIEDIKENSDLTYEQILSNKTKNGYAVIVEHGFDTRKLLSKWTDVTLKRDDLLLMSYLVNNEEL